MKKKPFGTHAVPKGFAVKSGYFVAQFPVAIAVR